MRHVALERNQMQHALRVYRAP
eukprot:SAG22_NODE_15749_length_341_cov_1.516529_1_plen_21_part_10